MPPSKRLRPTLVKLCTLTLGLLLCISIVNMKPVSGQWAPQRSPGGQQRPASQSGQLLQQQQQRLGQRPGAGASGAAQQRPFMPGRPGQGGGGQQRPGMPPALFGGGPGGGGPGFGPGPQGGEPLSQQVDELREELVQTVYELGEVKEEVAEIPDAVINEMENHGDFAEDYATGDGAKLRSLLTLGFLALVEIMDR